MTLLFLVYTEQYPDYHRILSGQAVLVRPALPNNRAKYPPPIWGLNGIIGGEYGQKEGEKANWLRNGIETEWNIQVGSRRTRAQKITFPFLTS